MPDDKQESLMAELRAIELWDRLQKEAPLRTEIECTGGLEARRRRRIEIIGEIDALLTKRIEILANVAVGQDRITAMTHDPHCAADIQVVQVFKPRT